MAGPTSDSENILVYNAKIYRSGEDDFSWMSFNKKSGLIQAVGRSEPPLSDISPENRMDLEGKRVLPGLHDSHMHLGRFSKKLAALDLYNCASIEELKAKLSKYSLENPDKKWLTGYQWEQDKLGRYPTRYDLDEVSEDRPVVLSRVCNHLAVLNSPGLKAIGLSKNTSNPEGSTFDRFPEGHPKAGELTGIIREANKYFLSHIEPTKDEMIHMLKAGIKKCMEFGITSAHVLEIDAWEALCDIANDGDLPIRIFYVAYFKYRDRLNFPQPGETHGPLLSCDRIKLFSDGALGVCTAALSVPYKDTDNKGLLLQPQEELTNLVADATSRGYRLEIHAIGDAGADAVLTALETAQVAPEKRPIIVHCQILRADLLKRMRRQGVIASVQPQFVLTDSRWLDDLLPEKLSEYLYPWKTIMDKGIPSCGGSDAPVESPEPLIGIYDAMFRPADVRGSEHVKCFRPNEKLTVTEAVDLYTKGGAYAAMREQCLGQLRPGFLADFVVLDSPRDVCLHPQDFCRAKAVQVWVSGVRKL